MHRLLLYSESVQIGRSFLLYQIMFELLIALDEEMPPAKVKPIMRRCNSNRIQNISNIFSETREAPTQSANADLLQLDNKIEQAMVRL